MLTFRLPEMLLKEILIIMTIISHPPLVPRRCTTHEARDYKRSRDHERARALASHTVRATGTLVLKINKFRPGP